MEKLERNLEKILKENDDREIEIEGLGKKTLADWKIEISQALKDEFADDPVYQQRVSK